MKVFWTDAALSQLQAIHDYYAEGAPSYAKSIVDRLTRRSKQIATFPHSGRMVPEYELPEVRQLIESRYRIIYLIKDDSIEVLAVLHTAQDALDPLA